MTNPYYEAIDRMEKSAVDPEYINGWACGYLHNPKREEQRLTAAYEAGYAAGLDRKPDGYEAWIRK